MHQGVLGLYRPRLDGQRELVQAAGHRGGRAADGEHPRLDRRRRPGQHPHLECDAADAVARRVRDVNHVRPRHVVGAQLETESNS